MSNDVVYWRKTTVVMKCIAISLLFLCRQEMNETGRRSGGSLMFQNTEESHLKAGWHPQSWWNTQESHMNTHGSQCSSVGQTMRGLMSTERFATELFGVLSIISWRQVSSTLSTVKSQVTCTALFSSHYNGYKETGWR